MIKVRVTDEEEFNFMSLNETKNGDVVGIYTLDEVKNYPNICQEEIKNAIYFADFSTVMGFVKSTSYTDEIPSFICVCEGECEVIGNEA